MPRISFLYRSLRRIPSFHSLPAAKLEAIVKQMKPKKYRSGQVIWRTEKQLDFWGVVGEGEILLEERSQGVVIRSIRLAVGEYVGPDRWKPKRNHIFLATALTDVQLQIFRGDQSNHGKPGAFIPKPKARPAPLRMAWLWNTLWVTLAALSIVAIGWRDISRILSGALVMEAQRKLSSSLDLAEPVKLLGIAESLDPDASFAYNQQGYWMFQAGDLQKAGESFAAAVDVDPAGGAALNNQAITFFTLGDIQKAVLIQELAVQNDPDNALVHYNLGIIQAGFGQGSEALRQFKEAAFIRPDWALPELQQALLYLQMRDYNKAEEAAGKAIRLDPELTAGHTVHAMALYEQGRDPEALAAVEKALALSPDEGVPNFYKALILSRQGRSEDALILLHQLFMYAQDPEDIIRIAAEIQYLEDSRQYSAPPTQ